MIEAPPLIYALRHTLRLALSSGIGSLIKLSVIEGFVMLVQPAIACFIIENPHKAARR